jgi:dTDP-4-dehydrorhamnose 3,5-epimerase
VPFSFTPLPGLPGPLLVQPRIFRDERGWFLESWKKSDFDAQGIGPFLQDNHSGNLRAGTVRGLHFQLAPQAQGKLVRCVRGRVWDVAVDLRPGPTFLRHAAVELSAAEFAQLWIPPGFAHGYCTLTDDSEVAYKTTAEYAPALERTLRWDDPDLAIPWPVLKAHLSPRDASAPGVAQSALPLVA